MMIKTRVIISFSYYDVLILFPLVYGNRAQRMKRAAAEWRQLDDCTRKLYTEKAAEENGSRPFNIDDLDEIAKKRWIKRQIKELQATVCIFTFKIHIACRQLNNQF